MSVVETAVTFERVTGTVGAIVHGIDLHDLPGEEISDGLRRALAEHGVLFFHAADGQVSDDEFRALASRFGKAFAYPYGPRRESTNEVGAIDFEDSARAVTSRTNQWHTDGTPQANPPYAALLAATVLPSAGGDTVWATMTGAYDALSSRIQRLLDGMEALHTTDNVARHYPPDLRTKVFGDGESSVHPVVPTEPITGRKFLYVNSNYTERLVGMTEGESRGLLEMLFQHVNTPEFHVRLRWQLGTVAVWHERVTQHRAIADFTERRALRRITITGEPPEA